jgi:BirA family biotin operon repressor/biotin-[acetyl-CoA-carboxylase] ligase
VEPAPVLPAGHRLLLRESMGSTNAEAIRLAGAGETGPLWIVAERQTAGRGRSGRPWTSEPGNLFASLLVTLPGHVAPSAFQLSLVAGVAVHEAIRAAGGLPQDVPLRLKWPNDILIGTGKVCGILVESSHSAQGLAAVIGIGVNITSQPAGTAQPATHLGLHGAPPDRLKLLEAIAEAVAGWLGRWQEGIGFATVRAAWLERAGPIGERCSVHVADTRAEGRFAGLDLDGALLMDIDGRRERVSFGDVSLG